MGKQIWLQDGNVFSQGSATTVSHPEGFCDANPVVNEDSNESSSL